MLCESKTVPLKKVVGDARAILVVNVASEDTNSIEKYGELKDLYRKYHSRGLQIIAVPYDRFGGK